MSDDLKKFRAFDAKLEWPVRIIFTVAIIYAALKTTNCNEPSTYIEGVFGLLLIAIWSYFYKLRILSALALILVIMLAFGHR